MVAHINVSITCVFCCFNERNFSNFYIRVNSAGGGEGREKWENRLIHFFILIFHTHISFLGEGEIGSGNGLNWVNFLCAPALLHSPTCGANMCVCASSVDNVAINFWWRALDQTFGTPTKSKSHSK